ncbi:MAG: UBP-type zinc finger domain-containing protein [Ignavibacteriae bacterium]|nr:UBP-type zinc finger domain-containing protein [Ignavibacteriota bacterium]MCB9214716.1 UBP-type zinc finger domain-containing protein [Ignavibacteria bacterium]
MSKLVEFHTSATESTCNHLDHITTVTPSAEGGEECLKSGDPWVHLRICMVCGHVGCCDSSINKHATKHFHETGHPIMKSFEPGEEWGWCYVDEEFLRPA